MSLYLMSISTTIEGQIYNNDKGKNSIIYKIENKRASDAFDGGQKRGKERGSEKERRGWGK